jgi:GLPGLI family protein
MRSKSPYKSVLFILLCLFFLCTSGEPLPYPIKGEHYIIDTTIIRCKYIERCTLDSLQPLAYRDYTMLLQIGKKISKVLDYKYYLRDSLFEEIMNENIDENSKYHKLVNIARNGHPTEIIKKFPVGEITITDRIPYDSYKYTEKIPSFNWALTNDTLTILGYRCNKATTRFRGRNWEVWFTLEIPISDGPWKFSGLPGLILKATEDKKNFEFTCIAVEKPNRTDEITFLNGNYIETTKADFRTLKQRYADNPAAFSSFSELAPSTPTVKKPRKITLVSMELSEE